MPLYTYEHPETGETLDVIQGMNDEHVYVGEDGIKWNRVFYSPEASIDSSIDPFSNQAFVEKNYKGKLDFRTTLYSDCITSCSFQLEKGERYLIFSDLNNGNIDFCDYIIPFSDSTFMLIKSYLDEIAYVRLDYLELFETADKSGYKAKLTILNGEVNGVVNLFDEAGNTVLKGIVNNGQMQGYYEIRTFGTTEDEIWTGNYKNGKRTGDWVYKAIAKDGTQKVNRYILYQYEAGEVVKEADLSMEAQLKK